MSTVAPLAALVRSLLPDSDMVSDRELLDRFVRGGDQAAFELLVWRHGAMVWATCRRMLAPDRDAAEDACQATFVALATRADRVRDGGAIGAWLHRVAVRAAIDLIGSRERTRPLTANHRDLSDPGRDPAGLASDREIRTLLDAGLNGLPDKLRIPFVLCELEGRSNAEAATELGCPLGTIESRLTRARHQLRDWLTARGVTPAVGVAMMALPESVQAAMVRAGRVDECVGTAVRALAERATRAAIGAKGRAIVATGVVMALAAVTLGLASGDGPKGVDPPAVNAAAPVPPVARRTDAEGFPLPAGVIARLGSPRLRHGSWIKDTCFSADGKQLASVGYDHALRTWDGETGKQLIVVRRTEGEFERVAFAADGKVIVVAGHVGKTCDLWRIHATTGAVLARWKIDVTIPELPAIRFSPDGARLALGVVDGKQLVTINTDVGETAWVAKLADEIPGGVAFSPDGMLVAAATNEGTVRLFDDQGKPTGVLKDANASFKNVTLAPDGKVVAYDHAGSSLVAWDRATGKRIWKNQTRADYSLAFSPDGKILIRSAYGYTASTIDPTDGGSPGIGGKIGITFDSMVEATCTAFRPDGRVVAFGNVSGPICLHDVTTGKPVPPSADPPYEVRWMRFSRDGKTLYGWSADWFAWDVASGKQCRVTNTGWNYGVPLSPDGEFTASTVWYSGFRPVGLEDDGTRFEVNDARTGKLVHSSSGKAIQGTSWNDFTPDGKALIGGLHDGPIGVWALETGKEISRMSGHQGATLNHAFSANGRVLVTASRSDPLEEYSVRAWDWKAGKQLGKFNPGVGVVGVAASGDGRRVAAIAYTNAGGKPDPRHQAHVWDVASGKLLARVPQHGDGGYVALSPDGRLVATSARWKGTVWVYEVASGAERFVFKHEGEVTGLLFAPDGRTLVAASKEAPVYVWDVGGELAVAPPPWNPSDIEKIWPDLAGDPVKALTAIRLLRAYPARSLPVLRERARLPAALEAATLKQLFAEVASDDFKTREKATELLAEQGEVIQTALEAELARTESPEAQARLRGLLKRLDALTPQRWRLVRIVEAVEGMGTPGARALLESWASGSAGRPLADEASAALVRLRP